ncbi:MAG TPA: 3-hydroxyacyl-CoA dehydrogenase NAD-binding domain-containing protein [Candidatus Polarisedimenticolia bacterium]|nr:3-hydroxyacyl-CoA dehydrogenase NAD-binding domain-containing protein [Candidatus Polarisedimenticolia bacterium]
MEPRQATVPETGEKTLSMEGPGVVLETRRDGLAFLIFDRPHDKVNLLTAPVVAVLEILIDQAAHDKNVRGLVLMSAKPASFIAGADVNEIRSLRSIQEAEQASRKGQRLFDAIEALPFPVVAAINGTCLGGGTELSLACHFRIVADDRRVEIGLPEVRLGIIPGWGGTQRLPRLVGIGPGLDMILTGRSASARRAVAIGLADDMAPPETLLEAAEKLVLDAAEGRRRPRRRLSDSLVSRVNPLFQARIALAALIARRNLRARVNEAHYPAPYRALEAVVHGLRGGIDAGLQREAELLGPLASGRTSKNLVSVFLMQQAARRDPGVDDPSVRPREVRAAAVIGAGVMGGGIAQALARAGLPVRLKDIDAVALSRGLSHAHDLFKDEVRKERLSRREGEQKLDLISPTLEYTGLRRCDVVIEAVVESLAVKHKVLREVESAVPEGFLFATNTSSLPIDAIGAEARRPEEVVGLHFFNPVHKMPLLEVIRGPRTSQEALATAVALAKRIGKIPVVVGDAPGFLVNRILMSYLGEALVMLEEGGLIEEIDRVMLDFGMPMGPLALLDQIGIDVASHVAGVLSEAFRDRSPRSTALQILKDKGWLGRKSGRGFYLYSSGAADGGAAEKSGAGGSGETSGARRRSRRPEGPPREVNEAVYGLVSARPRHHLDAGPTETRLVLPMINEAARCLEGGIVANPSRVDLAMVLGTGFPPFRGGLLRHADTLGLTAVVQGLEALAGRHGQRFLATRLLLELAREGRGFFENE